MLRAAVRAGTPLGKEAKEVMAAGKLVSDDLIIALVKERIAEEDCANGFLFDGFPRTIPQAQAIVEAGIRIDHVLEIAVDDEEIVRRLSGRRVHESSGRIYHVTYNPPQKPGRSAHASTRTVIDDLPIRERLDTLARASEAVLLHLSYQEDTVRARLHVYHEQTAPLVHFYQALEGEDAPAYHRVEGVGSVEEIKQKVLAALT